MNDQQCHDNHQEIMNELIRINKRMDDDWIIIKATNEDRIRREGIWNVLKWMGFGTITGLIVHFF